MLQRIGNVERGDTQSLPSYLTGQRCKEWTHKHALNALPHPGTKFTPGSVQSRSYANSCLYKCAPVFPTCSHKPCTRGGFRNLLPLPQVTIHAVRMECECRSQGQIQAVPPFWRRFLIPRKLLDPPKIAAGPQICCQVISLGMWHSSYLLSIHAIHIECTQREANRGGGGGGPARGGGGGGVPSLLEKIV